MGAIADLGKITRSLEAAQAMRTSLIRLSPTIAARIGSKQRAVIIGRRHALAVDTQSSESRQDRSTAPLFQARPGNIVGFVRLSLGGTGERPSSEPLAERCTKGPQIGLIVAPSSHRTVVDGAAHLSETGRPNAPHLTVKVEATRVPVEAAMRQDAAGLPLQIRHHVFVRYVQHRPFWQHVAPIVHERLIPAIISTKFRKIISVREALGEQS